MSDTTIYLLVGLAPLAVGAILALLNSNPVNAFVDRAMALASGKHSSASMSGGTLNTSLVAPFLFSIRYQDWYEARQITELSREERPDES